MRPLIGTQLKRFVRDYRRQHPLSCDLIAILQSVEYPMNVGSIFRLADAAGLTELVLTGITPQPPNPTIDKVARHKTGRVAWRYEANPVTAVDQLRADGYHVVAVELTEGAVPYHEYRFPSRSCLVVGHEDHGVTRPTLATCDAAVFLPMYGKGLSLNVHVALSIVVYHIIHCTHKESA